MVSSSTQLFISGLRHNFRMCALTAGFCSDATWIMLHTHFGKKIDRCSIDMSLPFSSALFDRLTNHHFRLVFAKLNTLACVEMCYCLNDWVITNQHYFQPFIFPIWYPSNPLQRLHTHIDPHAPHSSCSSSSSDTWTNSSCASKCAVPSNYWLLVVGLHHAKVWSESSSIFDRCFHVCVLTSTLQIISSMLRTVHQICASVRAPSLSICRFVKPGPNIWLFFGFTWKTRLKLGKVEIVESEVVGIVCWTYCEHARFASGTHSTPPCTITSRRSSTWPLRSMAAGAWLARWRDWERNCARSRRNALMWVNCRHLLGANHV